MTDVEEAQGAAIGGTPTEFAVAARELAEAKGVAPTLRAVVQNAVSMLECDWAIVAATDHLGQRPARLSAATDPAVAETIAAVAAEAGDSPGIRAFDEGRVVVVHDLASDGRFPSYAQELTRRTCIRSVLSIPLLMHGASQGVLSCYATRPGAFDESTVANAEALAVHAIVAIEAARDEVRADNLEIALLTSRTIGAAIGILVERHKITADAGWELLRKASQDLNRPLATLATELLETGRLDGLPDPPSPVTTDPVPGDRADEGT